MDVEKKKTKRAPEELIINLVKKLKRAANCRGSELSLERAQLHALEPLAGLTPSRFHGARGDSRADCV